MKDKEIKKLVGKVFGNKRGRELISEILTCDREIDTLKRNRGHWEARKMQARSKLITEFELTPEEDMTIAIAIGVEGIEKLMEDTVKGKKETVT